MALRLSEGLGSAALDMQRNLDCQDIDIFRGPPRMPPLRAWGRGVLCVPAATNVRWETRCWLRRPDELTENQVPAEVGHFDAPLPLQSSLLQPTYLTQVLLRLPSCADAVSFSSPEPDATLLVLACARSRLLGVVKQLLLQVSMNSIASRHGRRRIQDC